LDGYKNNSGVELVSFVDTDFEKAQHFAREAGGRAVAHHKEMIREIKLDGVTVCTIPASHRVIVLDLLNAGVHVLCEKPLAVSMAEAREMVGSAKERNLLLLTAYKFRFFDEVLQAKELIEKGSLGRILNFRLMFGGYLDAGGTWYSHKEFSGGGVIMDNGPHAIDLIRYLMGEIREISAQAGHFQAIPVEDTSKLTFYMDSGSVGTADLSWSASIPSRSYLEIYGEDGAALLDFEGITYKYKTWNDWKRIPNRLKAKESFSRQIDHFVDAIRNGKPTRIDNQDGLKAQMAIEAAYESIILDKKVAIRKA